MPQNAAQFKTKWEDNRENSQIFYFLMGVGGKGREAIEWGITFPFQVQESATECRKDTEQWPSADRLRGESWGQQLVPLSIKHLPTFTVP